MASITFFADNNPEDSRDEDCVAITVTIDGSAESIFSVATELWATIDAQLNPEYTEVLAEPKVTLGDLSDFVASYWKK